MQIYYHNFKLLYLHKRIIKIIFIKNFGGIYGEDKTPDYAIINANFGYKFNINKSKLITKFGIENILDTNYSTYSDWNNFPRQGRNFFVNLSIIL